MLYCGLQARPLKFQPSGGVGTWRLSVGPWAGLFGGVTSADWSTSGCEGRSRQLEGCGRFVMMPSMLGSCLVLLSAERRPGASG